MPFSTTLHTLRISATLKTKAGSFTGMLGSGRGVCIAETKKYMIHGNWSNEYETINNCIQQNCCVVFEFLLPSFSACRRAPHRA